MKWKLSVVMLICVLFFAACGESPVEDAAVAVIIIDGLRPDKLEEAHTPFLDELQADGAFTPQALAVMPTITRANFVTIPTGVHTDRHGVVGGTYRDDDYNEQRTDAPTYRDAQEDVPVPTLFEILEEHGKSTAMFAMKGYELVGARGASVQKSGGDIYPDEIWRYRYDRAVDGSEDEALRRKIRMNEIVIDTLAAVIERGRLDFILINLGATDYIGHVYGPESEAYRESIEAADRHVSRLAGMLQGQFPEREWFFIIGSDHGFTQTNEDQVALPVDNDPNTIPELARQNIEHTLYERGGRAAELYLQNPDQYSNAFDIIRELPWIKNIYTNHDIPERAGTLDALRINYTGRSGDFFITTDPSYALNFANSGQHGSEDDVDVYIPLYIYAPGRVDPGTTIGSASNLDIAPTVGQLFMIDDARFAQMEGSGLIN